MGGYNPPEKIKSFSPPFDDRFPRRSSLSERAIILLKPNFKNTDNRFRVKTNIALGFKGVSWTRRGDALYIAMPFT
jgi:hypothetical protein